MHIWHGQAPSGRLGCKINPLQYIKRVITTQNLRNDLKIGRTRNSAFTSIFLSTIFVYQKKYHIVEPFSHANCFVSPESRMRFVKALLHPCSYLEECPLCRQKFKDMCDHLITTCPPITEFRKKLHLKLILYNYPAKNFPLTKAGIIKHALSNRLWRKCFAEFLIEVDF